MIADPITDTAVCAICGDYTTNWSVCELCSETVCPDHTQIVDGSEFCTRVEVQPDERCFAKETRNGVTVSAEKKEDK